MCFKLRESCYLFLSGLSKIHTHKIKLKKTKQTTTKQQHKTKKQPTNLLQKNPAIQFPGYSVLFFMDQAIGMDIACIVQPITFS